MLLFTLFSDGGKYSNGIITQSYRQGQNIEVTIYLSASHLGYFEFRIGAFDERPTEGDSIGKLKGHLMELVSLAISCRSYL